LPDELRAAGYDLREAGQGERIIAGTIVEKLTSTSCSVLEITTEGSTKPLAEVRRHAGIVRTRRYRLQMQLQNSRLNVTGQTII